MIQISIITLNHTHFIIFRIASGPKPKEETKERKSSIDGKERKSSIADGREKKEGKEKLTKTAAAANSVSVVSIRHFFFDKKKWNNTNPENTSDWQCCDDVKTKVKEPAQSDHLK